MNPFRLPGASADVRDLGAIGLLVAGFFALSAYFELSETLGRLTRGYESLQLDELPLTLVLLSASLAWFALRRARDARCQLAERVRAEARVAELLAHNRDLSQRLILVQDNERRALARELHDEVGQNCTAIRAEASFIMHAGAGECVAASAGRIAAAAEALYVMVRGMLQRLRPQTLDSLGLESAIQELCENWEEQTGIACGFFPHGCDAPLQDGVQVAIFRLVQEALTNVARHADATRVKITLQPVRPGAASPAIPSLRLVIEDDGRGLAQPDGAHRGFGLIGMRERVAALHGAIRFDSEPGRGLRIAVELPLEGAP